jgi:hypothetical protein
LPDAASFVAASAGAWLDAIHPPDYIQKQMTRVTHTIARMQRSTGCRTAGCCTADCGTADRVMWRHRVRTVASLGGTAPALRGGTMSIGLVCVVSIAKGAPD